MPVVRRITINENGSELLSKQIQWATCQCQNVIYILLYLLVLSPRRVPGDITSTESKGEAEQGMYSYNLRNLCEGGGN